MEKQPKNAIALTAALSLLPVAVDTTIVNVGLIPVGKALDTDFNTVQWISVGYLLANAAVIAISGYLGTRVGVKRLFSLSIVCFGLFSLLCGIAPSISWLIAFRVLQGLGGGALIPLGIAIALEPFEKEERVKAMALVGLPVLLGPVIAPVLGGLIIDNISWEFIFFVNVPFCLLAFLLALIYIPADPSLDQIPAGFDYPGLVLSTLGVVSLIYSFKLVGTRNPESVPTGQVYGWGYWQVWVLLGAGLLLLLVFGIQALFFSRDPVLDLRLFAVREFLTGNLVNWVYSIVMFGVLALIPQFLQQVRLPNLSALDTGLAMTPMGLGTIVGVIGARRLYPLVGARPLGVASGLLAALGFWGLTGLTPTTSGGDLWPVMTLLGLSVATCTGVVMTVATESLTGEALNKASSLFQSTKLLFGAIGSSILVTFLVQQTGDYTVPARDRLLKTFPVPTNTAQTADLRQQVAALAGTDAIKDIFSLLIWVALVMAVVALTLPGRSRKTGIPAETGEAYK
jgi:EmrB/QacA subfamily drug resistance transporter